MTDREIIDKVNKRLGNNSYWDNKYHYGFRGGYVVVFDRVLVRYARLIERARIKIEMLDWYHAQGKE